jgi:ABC-type enterobactin transport system permease subunit
LDVGELLVVPPALAALSGAHEVAAAAVSDAAAVDSQAMLAAVMAAVGPIGASYLAAFAPTLGKHLHATSQLALLHAAASGATDASMSAFAAVDNA